MPLGRDLVSHRSGVRDQVDCDLAPIKLAAPLVFLDRLRETLRLDPRTVPCSTDYWLLNTDYRLPALLTLPAWANAWLPSRGPTGRAIDKTTNQRRHIFAAPNRCDVNEDRRVTNRGKTDSIGYRHASERGTTATPSPRSTSATAVDGASLLGERNSAGRTLKQRSLKFFL